MPSGAEVVCVNGPELVSKGFVDSSWAVGVWDMPFGFPKLEVGEGLEPGTVPSAGDRKGLKGDAVASSLGR